jgi:hypothetical protein
MDGRPCTLGCATEPGLQADSSAACALTTMTCSLLIGRQPHRSGSLRRRAPGSVRHSAPPTTYCIGSGALAAIRCCDPTPGHDWPQRPRQLERLAGASSHSHDERYCPQHQVGQRQQGGQRDRPRAHDGLRRPRNGRTTTVPRPTRAGPLGTRSGVRMPVDPAVWSSPQRGPPLHRMLTSFTECTEPAHHAVRRNAKWAREPGPSGPVRRPHLVTRRLRLSLHGVDMDDTAYGA